MPCDGSAAKARDERATVTSTGSVADRLKLTTATSREAAVQKGSVTEVVEPPARDTVR
jgi:hypothetical protein